MSCLEFKDADFKHSIAKILGLTGSDINRDDLVEIDSVIITDSDSGGLSIPWSGDDFSMMFPKLRYRPNLNNQLWLKDLKHLSHIKSLHIYVPTEKLDTLHELTNIHELYITNSCETNWSWIENLTRLQSLYIRNAQFADLKPIANLSMKQNQRYIQSNSKDFWFLKKLFLNYCEIEDITPLRQCSNIVELNLSHNRIADLQPLESLKWLYYLTLRYNRIQDISPLARLPYIYAINLRHNQISDISPLSRFNSSNLSRLYLRHNEITDYAAINKLSINLSD